MSTIALQKHGSRTRVACMRRSGCGWTAFGVAVAMTVGLACGPLTAPAAPISADQAAARVAAWYASDGNPFDAGWTGKTGDVDAYPGPDGTTAWYVVNLLPEGYAIVVADDAVSPPIVAFASKGAFDPAPDSGLYHFLRQDIPARIAAAHAAGKTATTRVAGGARPAAAETPPPQDNICRVRVPPLLASRWDQGNVQGAPCYNYYTWSNAPAGDVSLLVAQTVHLHRQEPSGGVGHKLYVIEKNSDPAFAFTRGGDGLGGPYDWDHMVDDPASTTLTETDRQAIGALCADAGVVIGANYDLIHGTITDLGRVTDILSSTFGFAQGGVSAPYNGEDPLSVTNEATRMINPNLDAGFPVFLALTQGDAGAGYAVACDGYGFSHDAKLEFWMFHHLNFGQGGANNVWYALPKVPAGTVFTNITGIIYNMMPRQQGEIVSGRITDQNGPDEGMSMPGITVWITDFSTFATSTVTGPKGIYSFVVPPSRTYTVFPFPPGAPFTPALATVTVGDSLSGTCGNVWGVNFRATSYAVAGRITLADGSPLPGVSVALSGLQTVVSDLDGFYVTPAPSGWSGTLTPSLPLGGLFDPTNIVIAGLGGDSLSNDFVWTAPTLFAVSGPILRADTLADVTNATITFSGVGVTASTDPNGDYVAYVPTNWTGTATPSHIDGGAFFPSSRSYTNLAGDIGFQYYFWLPPLTNTISGRVIRRDTGDPVSNVVFTTEDGLTATSDSSGAYSITVPYLWSGNITPSHPLGGAFRPGSRAYSLVRRNVTGQNYLWTPPLPTINGQVSRHDYPNGPVAGVTITLSSGSGHATTTADGNYQLLVPVGWSGTVTPSHPDGGVFDPTNYVLGIRAGGTTTNCNFSWTPPQLAISGRVTRAGTSVPAAGVTVTFIDQIYVPGLYGNPFMPTVSGGPNFVTQTDADGYYMKIVPYGWTGVLVLSPPLGGTITPRFTINFNLANAMMVNAYFPFVDNSSVAGKTFDFLWHPPRPFVKGTVTRGDGPYGPVSGVTIRFSDGTTAMTLADGTYSNAFDLGWSGTATPTHPAGGTFDPASMPLIDALTSDYTQDYRWFPPLQTISGRVTRVDNGIPVAGVIVTFSNATDSSSAPAIGGGSPVPAITDTNGVYGISVPFGWSGSGTPSHPRGGTFTPIQRIYNNVAGSRATDDYTWAPPPPIIAGRVVRFDDGRGVPDVRVIFSNDAAFVAMGYTNPLAVVYTDTNGNYSATVLRNWSGTVTPTNPVFGGTFLPANTAYAGVTEDVTDTNVTGFAWHPPFAGLTLVADPASRGTIVSTGLSYTVGARFDIAAVPQPDSCFLSWQDGVTNAFRTIYLPPGGTNYTAFFVELGPVIAISGTLEFGDVLVGKSSTRTITVSNPGTRSFTVLGVATPLFYLVLPGTFTVNPGASQSVSVRFLPTVEGAATGTLTFATLPAALGVPTIAVRGNGVTVADWLEFTGSTDFGDVVVGQSVTRSIRVRNVGGSSITIGSATWSSTDFTLTGLPATLAPGAAKTLTVRFAPKQAKSYAGTSLKLTTTTPRDSVAVMFRGTAHANVAGTWVATLGGRNYTLYLWQSVRLVDGRLTCRQNAAVNDQYVATVDRTVLAGGLLNASVNVGDMTVTNASVYLTGHLTRKTVGTNLPIRWTRSSTVVPGTVSRPVRPLAAPLAAPASAVVGPGLQVTLLALVPAWLVPEDAEMLVVKVAGGRLVAESPALDALGMPTLLLTWLEAQGEDADVNGLPDAIEAGFGGAPVDGMPLLVVRRHAGCAVPEAPFAGTRVQGGAVPLNAMPAVWTLVPKAP